MNSVKKKPITWTFENDRFYLGQPFTKERQSQIMLNFLSWLNPREQIQ